MSFRLFNSNFWRAALVGWVCLAFAGAARAGEGARNIEVVPFHNTSMDTNFDKPVQDDSQSFKVWQPVAPDSLRSSAPNRPTPLPQPQSPSREEQQMQDRRRNWVFMTPEDYTTTDPKTGKNILGWDNDKDNNMTAMERYYHRLEQSAKPSATNDLGRLNPDRMTASTNYFDSAVRNTDPSMFGPAPFDSSRQADVFQSIGNGNSANVFGGDTAATRQSPEEARTQTEQKVHMESFKQLWNIDQASSAATPVVAQPSGPIDSAPLFGASTPGMSTPFKPNLPSSPGNPVRPLTPAGQPVTAPRYTQPVHSDFTPIQRPF